MSTCISAQAKLWEGKLKPGDVLITNHPDIGGTHLPDITVITPSFSSTGELIFYVASRAHHADIGGILPGSVPPNSKRVVRRRNRNLFRIGCQRGNFPGRINLQTFRRRSRQIPRLLRFKKI
ncbi:AEL_collapsed_G0032140.mRNA.1.CDS.1 [Saccharomyces cerevisiae]|nr:AEL_collapsed_G0032140.mRNA.1.CDS.1 [Saccharomyces cerevisiae]